MQCDGFLIDSLVTEVDSKLLADSNESGQPWLSLDQWD